MNVMAIAKRTLALLCVLFLPGLAGCAMNRFQAPFVWTTDHRLSPEERFVSVNASPQTVFAELSKWVRDRSGNIVRTETFPNTFKVQPGSTEKFRESRAIAQHYWTALVMEKYQGFTPEDGQKLKDLGEQQIVKDSSDSPGYFIEAKLDRRTATILYQENVGGSLLPIYTPGFSSLTPRGQIVHVPGSLTSFYQPTQSVTRRMTNHFSSLLRFYVFTDQGRTKVFATGAPVDESAAVVAAPDRTIGRPWWSHVTAKEEESLIKEAFSVLAKIEANDDLSESTKR